MSLPILLGYQQRWVMDDSRVKVCVKSRRIGITWASAYAAVLRAAANRSAGGRNVWYQTYADDDAKEFIVDVAKFARMLGLVFAEEVRVVCAGDDPDDEADEWCLLPEGRASVQISSIRFRSGFRVTALPSPPRKLRGKDGIYILDEADSHDDLVGALQAASAFLTWGGQVEVISTQGDVDGEFNRLVDDIKSGRGTRAKYSLHEITLLDAVRDGLYRRVCEVEGREWTAEGEREWTDELLETEGADTEFLCIPRRSGGQYIPRAIVEPCTTTDYPVLRYEADDGFLQRDETTRDRVIDRWCTDSLGPLLEKLPARRAHYLGEDFGRSSDMTTFAIGYEGQDLTLQVPLLVELANVPYESQRRVAFYVMDRLPSLRRAAFDATGNGGYLAEQARLRWGETIVDEVKITRPWYADTLPKLRARFQDRAIQIPRDIDVIDDLAQFRVVDGIPLLPKQRTRAKGHKGKRHGDAGVALACLVHAVGIGRTSSNRYQPVAKRGGPFAQEGIL